MTIHPFRSTLLIALAIATTASVASAQHQAMGVRKQTITLAAGETQTPAAYCLDFDKVWPDEGMALPHIATGADTAQVCGGGKCQPLQAAIDEGRIVVEGTGAYSVRFKNATDEALTIELGAPLAMSDAARTVDAPQVLLGETHDGVTQYRVWRSRGQVGPLVRIEVTQSGKGFRILGFDSFDALREPAAVIKDAKETELASLLAEVTDQSDAVVIETPLSKGKTAKLVANLRIKSAAHTLLAEDYDYLGPVTDLGTPTPFKVKDSTRQFSWTFGMTADGGEVPGQILVEYANKPKPTLRAKFGDAITRAFVKARGLLTGRSTVGASAQVLRNAVALEIEALSKVDPATVWVLMGDPVHGYRFAKIVIGRTPWTA